MPIKRYKAEQMVTLLRQIEVGIANGKLTPQACKEAEITGEELSGKPVTLPNPQLDRGPGHDRGIYMRRHWA